MGGGAARSFLAGGLARVFSKTVQLCPCHERVPLVKAREDENDDLSSAAYPWLLLSHVANLLDVFDWGRSLEDAIGFAPA